MCEPVVVSDDYHVDVVREKLTRMLPSILLDVIDEVAVAVEDNITSSENGRPMRCLLVRVVSRVCVLEWTSLELMLVMRAIVNRANQRAFVGLPLCEQIPCM